MNLFLIFCCFADSYTFFTCVHCGRLSPSVKNHELHFLTHRHLSQKIVCGFEKCSSVLPNGSAFRSHVTRAHRRSVPIIQHPYLAHLPMNENGQYKCPVEFCSERFFYSRLLNQHIKEHLNTGITCPCLVPLCTKKFSTMNSLTGHMSKCHRKLSTQSQVTVTPQAEYIESAEVFENEDTCLSVVLSEETVAANQPEESLRTLAQFYQRLAYKHLVPQSTVQIIAEEVKILMCNNQQILLDNLNVALKSSQVSSEVINKAFDSATRKNDLPQMFHQLRTDYMRKKAFRSLFAFVEPQPVNLHDGNFFYYVPIGETLQACFTNRAWVKYLKSDPQISQDGVLRDFTDGEAFRNNSFFLENPNAIMLIMYQDGFELVNPLGPAKNLKHNVIGVYMAVGNLPSDIRFRKDSIQLVALCKKDEFNHELVYGKIVQDILKLQNSGLELPGVGNVKVGVPYIAGDNLGSHGLGGYVENFSKSVYFCRFCRLDRPSFLRDGGEVKHFKSRTKETYCNALCQLRETRKKSCFGIKLDSVFNQLQGFHVSDNGLPPCMGHDLCEGVIAYDLKLFIKYFVEKKYFSLETLNNIIESFPYSTEDRQDRPVKIKKLEKTKLAGGAWQIRTFLRLFPLMISEFVDHNDEVWKCMLKLGEITDIVVSPEIHVSQIPGLQSLIEEYLVMRRELFPSVRLRPKHHYMFHYGILSLVHGCLIRVWTMRFESKHCFFKTAWRNCRNSINILKMLSFKHEFLQSYVRSGGGTSFETETSTRFKFVPSVYSAVILNAISRVGSFSRFEQCGYVTIKGTHYKKGHVVILNQSELHDVLEVGTIFMILIDVNDTVKFVVQKGTGKRCPLTRAYKMTTCDGFQCVAYEDLLSFYPLTPYVVDTGKYLVLKHSIVKTELV